MYYHFASQIINQEKLYINVCIIKMGSNHKLKEIDIENCTCYYFDGIIKTAEFNLNNILIDEQSYEDT